MAVAAGMRAASAAVAAVPVSTAVSSQKARFQQLQTLYGLAICIRHRWAYSRATQSEAAGLVSASGHWISAGLCLGFRLRVG